MVEKEFIVLVGGGEVSMGGGELNETILLEIQKFQNSHPDAQIVVAGTNVSFFAQNLKNVHILSDDNDNVVENVNNVSTFLKNEPRSHVHIVTTLGNYPINNFLATKKLSTHNIYFIVATDPLGNVGYRNTINKNRELMLNLVTAR